MSTPFPYLALNDKGWHLTMGLRPLDHSRWLEVDARRDEELTLKRELLATSRDSVVATRPAGYKASEELLALVVEFLGTHHPHLGVPVRSDEHPIVAASRLIQEDLCVMVRDDHWRLQAACVCFPSRWSLARKIGGTLDEIHAPVPGYAGELGGPTNALFDRLGPARSFWRLNWTLLDSPALHQPARTSVGPSATLDEWFLRVERQTLRRLPSSGAIAFTIRTYVSSLADLVERHDGLAANVLLALDTAPDDVKRYKGWSGVGDRLRRPLTR